MVACLSEELDSRRLGGSHIASLTAGDLRALDLLMDKVNAFDVEARKIIAEMEVSAKECILLAQGDRKGTSAAMISAGLQRAAVNAMPSK